MASDLRYDLHSHTLASDGSLTAEELVSRAVEHNVDVLAISDHDTVASIDRAIIASQHRPISIIPGVEISTSWNKHEIHIVGLNINHNSASLNAKLLSQQVLRRDRAQAISDKLSEVGIDGCFQQIINTAERVSLGRLHIAQWLVDEGHVKDVPKAFKRYLAQGKVAYEPTQWCGIADAVSWIHDAGGVAVLAHPLKYGLSATKCRLLISYFHECGGTSIEVVSGKQRPQDTTTLLQYADRWSLLASLGSDFHTPGKSWAELGSAQLLPKSCTPVWGEFSSI